MSNTKGSIGQAFIVAHLLESGYNVLLPATAGLPYDIVVERDGQYRRVQCKYRTAEAGAIKVPKRNSDHRGFETVAYSKANIDAFAVYSPDSRQVYYVPVEELDGISKHLCLRLVPARNNQAKGIRMATEYLDPQRLFAQPGP